MLASSSRAPLPSGRSQSADDRPLTLEAMTSLSRPPRALSHVPMIRSVEPCVSARGGIEYISAVSMKLMPRSDREVELGVALGFGVLLPPGHRTEAQGRDLEAGAAELAHFEHDGDLLRRA